MNSIEKTVDDLINGNLTDARRRAKNLGAVKLIEAFQEIGWTAEKAVLATKYLKTGNGFQAYCDAK